jgi:hypothetical protein
LPASEDFDESEELDTQTKGKMGELVVLGELLKRGFQVYQPMVDTGIDCLVDVGDGNFKEIQIKSREDESIFTPRMFKPRNRFFLICSVNSKRGDFLWVFPSAVFHENATRFKNKKGKEFLQLRIGPEGSETFEKFREYRDNFQKLLVGATPEVRMTVRKASKRVEGEHFKQPDFMREILLVMSTVDKPLQGKEIFERLAANLSDKFSSWDLEIGKSNEPRWKKTAAFAFYRGLVPQKLVEARAKNQWVLTEKGRLAKKELLEFKGEDKLDQLLRSVKNS